MDPDLPIRRRFRYQLPVTLMLMQATDTPPVTLEDLPPGRPARILAIEGPRDLRHRLLGLGLHPGGTITVLQRQSRGLVVATGATRVALDTRMARSLRVEAAS